MWKSAIPAKCNVRALHSHIYLIEGERFVTQMQDAENTELNKTQGRQHWSRLACQTLFEGGGNLVVEIRN